MEPDGDANWMRRRPSTETTSGQLKSVDLFAGCGGMTLGFDAVAREAGYAVGGLAVEIDPVIASTYAANFPGMRTVSGSVESLFDGACGDPLTESEVRVKNGFGEPDLLMGGPPCQGHSDLNNHTRRSDPRNLLYLRMARAAEVLEPMTIVIENVPSVVHDSSGVVDQTVDVLSHRGYAVAHRVLPMNDVGVPQNRRRHVLIASRCEASPETVFDRLTSLGVRDRTVRWAIEDLVDADESHLDLPARRSTENVMRMKHLFAHGIYDLPDELRPPCHRDKPHSYNAVYGRLRWDRPAPTITTGFTSMGQGRYVHPEKQRTLTPHEAARLQSFPDWFDWHTERRTLLATMIGNAVPPLLMARIGSELLDGIQNSGR